MPSVEELRQELEWRRCRGSGPSDWKACLHFLQHHWYIRHPERGKILFDLREAQEETLQLWLTKRYSIVLKARQIGFSTLAAGMAFWLVFFHADKFVIMLSRTERESVKLLAKAKYGFKHLPEWMKARGPSITADHQQKMPFDNDSSIESLPSNNDPARGESVYMVIVDEWAFLPNAEEAWASIEPVADVGGRVIGLSTANGSGDFFHGMWVRATTGGSEFTPIFFPWSAGGRDQAWYETKKRTMQEWQLHQEYPSSPEEAFIKSGRPVFDVEALDLIATESPIQGWLEPIGQRTPEFRHNVDGALHVWDPPRSGHKYVIGADVAEGLEHGDYSVAHVIDVAEGKVVAKWRAHIDPDLFGEEVLWLLGWWYNRALIGVEANNHGYTTCSALTRLGYPNLYYRHSYDERTHRRSRKVGWYTNAKTKPLLVDELNASLRGDEPDLRLLDDETIGELRTFVRDERGRMHGSPYDDQVMSLGIANQMRKHSFVLAEEEAENDEWTLAWWVRLADDADAADNDWIVGRHSVRA